MKRFLDAFKVGLAVLGFVKLVFGVIGVDVPFSDGDFLAAYAGLVGILGFALRRGMEP